MNSEFVKIIFCCFIAVIFLTACVKHSDVVNTSKMPGRKVEKMLNPKPKGKSVERAKNGVVIIRENSTTNNTGYDFKTNSDINIGPGEIKFRSENKLKTRY